MLYDLRNYDKEPFSVFPISDDSYLQNLSYPPRMPEFNKLEFSNDGKSILVGTTGGVHYILDAFAGGIKARLIDHQPTNPPGLSSGDVCFTPDGRYVLGGIPWPNDPNRRKRGQQNSHLGCTTGWAGCIIVPHT
jgi:COMPASS component SWD2